MSDHDYICERCGKPITADTTVWLEMRISTGRYVPETTVLPDDDNQGCFPFGSDCAKHPNRLYPGRRI